MNIQIINLEWIDVPVHEFLDNQKSFLIDASIICGGFHNIINHEHTCSDKFMDRLQILYSKIYERYLITLGLSDNIVGKQEIQMWMWKILQDIDMMREYCIHERA
jgi:hypothetical protein